MWDGDIWQTPLTSTTWMDLENMMVSERSHKDHIWSLFMAGGQEDG